MAPDSHFPQEIFDRVLDYLHDDKKTLVSCSTASQSLRNASICHLFSQVTVSAKGQDQPVIPLFLAFLSSLPATAIYIRRITITGDLKSNDSAHILSFQQIQEILGYASFLQDLELREIELQHRGSIEAETVESPRRLHSLVLNRCEFKQTLDGFSTLLEMTKPRCLHLHRPRCRLSEAEISNWEGGASPSITALTKVSFPMESLIVVGGWQVNSEEVKEFITLLECVLPSIRNATISSLREFTFLVGTWPSIFYPGRFHSQAGLSDCTNPDIPPTDRLGRAFSNLQRYAPKLESCIIGSSFSQSTASFRWEGWFSLLAHLPKNVQYIRSEILLPEFISPDVLIGPFIVDDFPSIFTTLPSLRTLAFRWGMPRMDLSGFAIDSMNKHWHRRWSDLLESGLMSSEFCPADELHKSSGVSLAEGNRLLWIKRQHWAWD